MSESQWQKSERLSDKLEALRFADKKRQEGYRAHTKRRHNYSSSWWIVRWRKTPKFPLAYKGPCAQLTLKQVAENGEKETEEAKPIQG